MISISLVSSQLNIPLWGVGEQIKLQIFLFTSNLQNTFLHNDPPPRPHLDCCFFIEKTEAP